MKTSTNDRIALSAVLLVAAGLLVAACGANGTARASSRCVTVTPSVAADGRAGRSSRGASLAAGRSAEVILPTSAAN